MSFRNLKILVLIFLVLLVAVSGLVYRAEIKTLISKDTPKIKIIDKTINTENVSSINISQNTDRVEIKRYDDGWKVNGKKADMQKVKDLITSFNNITLGEIISKNPENHIGFGLSPDEAILVDIYYQNETVSLALGYRGDTANSFFIKKKDESNLYIGQGDFYNNISVIEDDWINKIVVNIPKNSITKVEYQLKNKTAKFEETDSAWIAKINKKVSTMNEEDAISLVSIFESLEATGIADTQEKTDFEKAVKADLRVYDSEGLKSDLFYLAGDGVVYIASKNDPTIIYRILDYKFDALTKLLGE